MKRIATFALAFVLAALMLWSCTPASTPPSDPSDPTPDPSQPSGDPPQPTPGPGSDIPADLKIYEDAVTISMLRNTPFAQKIKSSGNIGLSETWKVGVDQDRFENEEIMAIPTDARVYDAADYGVTPDGQYNAANLNRLLSDLASVDGNKVIRFASGTYNFMSYIEIMKVNDLWLVGEDDTLFLYSGWVSYMRVTLSKNINIKNIQFDMKYSPTIAGTITKVDESGSDPVITIKVPEEFDLTASVYNNRLKEYSSYMECYYDEASGKYTPDYDGNLFYNTTTSNPAYMGIGKLSYNSATRELSIPLLRQFPWWSYRTPEIGTMVSFAYTMYDNTGMLFKDCEQVTIEDVNVYVTGGMGFRAERGMNYYLNRFNFMQKEGSARIMTCTADIIHTIAVEGDLKITNCTLESSHDDALNIKSFYTEITATSASERTLTVQQTQNEVTIPYAVGDTIEIYDPSTMEVLASYTVVDVQSQGTNYVLTIDKRPKSGLVGMSCGNVTKSTHLSLDNCIIGNKRNRGILLQCRESEIINCTFRNIIMGAVQVLSVNDSFREAILPYNITIANCKFMNNITDVSIFCYGNAASDAVAGTLKNTYVKNCFFTGSDGSACVNLQATGNAQVTGCLFDLTDHTVRNVLTCYKAQDTVFADNHVYTTYSSYSMVKLTDSESSCTQKNNTETKH